jgi:hypothetical protein
MRNGRSERTCIPDGGNESNALSTLESAQSYITASATTGEEGNGGRSTFKESFAALLNWGEATSLIHPEAEYSFLQRKPDGHGNEHEAWFHEDSNRWYKATYPNRFGLAWGRIGSATAGEYLTRLTLQNRYFGDDIHLVALVNCNEKLRVITSQPHIFGERAPYEEIQRWLCDLEFLRFISNDCVAWYRDSDNLLVSDAHEGNVIRSKTGALFAIDLNLMKPSQEMRETITSLLEISKSVI